jgi:hypothetical protein
MATVLILAIVTVVAAVLIFSSNGKSAAASPVTPTVLAVLPPPTEELMLINVLPAELPAELIPTATATTLPTVTPKPTSTPVPDEPTPIPTATVTPEPVPTRPPSPTPFPKVEGAPVALTIGSIGLNKSPVAPVGIEKIKMPNGSEASRWQAFDNKIGYQPTNQGEICKWGLTTLNGHNYLRGIRGVFWNLNKVKPGDTITITTDSGGTCDYVVEWSKVYAPTDTSWLYESEAVTSSTKAYLNIYTCSADFNDRYVLRASKPK